MKKIKLYKKFLVLFSMVAIASGSFAQPNATDGLSIKVSPGILSFYGDMSTEDYNPFFVLTESSKFGFSAGLIKQFNSWFAIQAQYAMGSMYSLKVIENADDKEMNGSLSEFGIAARFDPLPLILQRDQPMKLSPYVSLGLSTVGFRSVVRNHVTNNVLNPAIGFENDGVTKKNPKGNALAFPIGVGLSYNIVPELSLELEYAIRTTSTDLLDATAGNTNVNDYYSLATLGLRYHINPLSTKPRTRRPSSRNKVPLTRNNSTTNNRNRNDLAITNVFVESQIPEKMTVGRIYEVWTRINKGDYNGPGKLIQKYPEGFTAMESQSSYANFSFTNQNAIVEWDQMPADSVITYTYRLRVNESVAGSQTIAGRFEYDQPDGEKINRFNDYVFVENQLEEQMDRSVRELLGEDVSDDPVIKSNTEITETENLEEDEYNRRINELLGEYGGGERTVKTTDDKPVTVKTSQSVPGIEFRIQVGAFKDRSQGGTRLARKYGITEPMSEEMSNGWYKYTIGSFRTYTQAEQFRDSFIRRTNLMSAFIVAYKDGRRLLRLSDATR